MGMSSYPTKSFRRTALAPGILAAIVLLAGFALIGNPAAFFWIKTVVAILAAIVCVYAWQSKQWWWLVPLGAIVVVWNPVWPIAVRPDQLWLGLQYIAIIVFIATGLLIKIPNPDDKNKAISAARNRR
jgi:hypothetical protein